MSEPRAWIITGMSGAGKRTALDALARQSIECVDNLPPGLDAEWAALNSGVQRAAVIDARRGDALTGWLPPTNAGVIFLDARDEVLRRRLGDTTRPHPCAFAGSVADQINAERELLVPLRAAADAVIDTSDISAAELGGRVTSLVSGGAASAQRLRCVVSSFGYKYGPQTEADWVIDARFLPNPFWVAALRPLTGLDPEVSDFVLSAPETQEFLALLDGLLRWTADRYIAHRRAALHIAVGCTGGRHRSVAIAVALAARLAEHDGGQIDVSLRHRDVERPDPR